MIPAQQRITKGYWSFVLRLALLVAIIAAFIDISYQIYWEDLDRVLVHSWLQENISPSKDEDVQSLLQALGIFAQRFDFYMMNTGNLQVPDQLRDLPSLLNDPTSQNKNQWKYVSGRPGFPIRFDVGRFEVQKHHASVDVDGTVIKADKYKAVNINKVTDKKKIASLTFNRRILNQELSEDKDRFNNMVYALKQELDATGKGLNLDDYSGRFMTFLIRECGANQQVRKFVFRPVYMYARSSWAYASYPAKFSIFGDEYKPEDRPWYKSAFVMNSPYSESVPKFGPNYGITYAYPDIFTGDIVRTFWHRVDLPIKVGQSPKQYLVCVDLAMIPEWPHPGMCPMVNYLTSFLVKPSSSIANESPFASEFAHTLIMLFFGFVVVILIGLFISIFASYSILFQSQFQRLYFWISRITAFGLFGRTKPSIEYGYTYKKVNINDDRQVVEIDKTENSTKSRIGINISFKLLGGELATTRDRTWTKASQTTRRQTYPKDCRAAEEWTVSKVGVHSGQCRICGQAVTVGVINQKFNASVTYGAEDNPSVEIDTWAEDEIETRELSIFHIKRAIVWNGLSPHAQQTGLLVTPTAPRVPENITSVSAVDECINKFMNLENGRVEVFDCIGLTDKIYGQAHIKAVCRIGYLDTAFNRLKQDDDTGLMTAGTTKERVLVADNKTSMHGFFRTHEVRLLSALEDIKHEKGSSFRHLSLDQDVAEARLDEFDFAIIKKDGISCVLVSYVGDHDTLATEDGDKKIGGYMSWRICDVDYYTKIFEKFYTMSMKLTIQTVKSAAQYGDGQTANEGTICIEIPQQADVNDVHQNEQAWV